MKSKSPNKILCVLMAFVMFIPLFAGVFTIDIPDKALAADTVDEFRWNFSDLTAGMPIGENIAADTQNTTGRGTSQTIIKEKADFVAVHSAGTTLTGTEGASQILVDNQSSKWCNTGVNSSNAWFILDAGRQIKAPAYAIRGANDDTGYTTRYLHTWTIQGSNNAAGPWTTVSSPGSQGTGWTGNYQLRMFNFTANAIPDDGFRYYRLNITRHGNSSAGTALGTSNTTLQFSYIGLIFDYETVGFDGTTNYLFPQVNASLTTHWAGSRPTMNGPNVIQVNGNVASGSGNVHAKSYTTIKSGLNIEVYEDTKFNYMFAPEGVTATIASNTYDYKYHGAHMAIDLKFSDGTRLKDIAGAIDQYGIGIHPNDQGKGKVHKTYQWNFVEVELGKYAAGKVITDIILGFEMDNATRGQKAAGWFDDINIFRCPWGMDYSQIDLADFVDIRHGANSSSNATGAMTPSVALPYATQYWAPSTNRTGGDRYAWSGTQLQGIVTSHLASRHMGERITYLIQANSTTTATDNTSINNAVGSSGANYSHANEFAVSNYHYGVKYSNSGIAPNVSLEVTPTDNGAVFRFTFPAGAAARNIMFDSPMATGNGNSAITRSGQTFNAWIQNGADTNNSTTGNGALRRKFMYGEFNVSPSNFYIPATNNTRSMARFPNLANGPNGETIIEMRVATSWISAAQAQNNFKMDLIAPESYTKDQAIAISSWTTGDGKWFEAAKNESKEKWNEALGAVKFEDPNANYWQYSNFYSKLSRSQLFPTRLSEYTGRGTQGGWQYASPYRGTNANPTIVDGHMIYNEGWWDTFKSKWPLLGFLYPVNSEWLTDGIIQHYIDQDGRARANGNAVAAMNNSHAVPRWINPGGNNMMTGTSSDAVISHNYVNGVDFDKVMEGYYSWIKSSAVVTPLTSSGGRTGLHIGMFKGYHPWGSSTAAGGGGQLDTTWSLEGYLNDASQVHMLRKMAEDVDVNATIEGKSGAYWKQRWEEEATYYESRAKQYINLFNPARGGWFRNRNTNGTWYETDTAFNPLNWGSGYCEDNAWPYRFLTPQDGNGLANLMGGKDKLREALDAAHNAEGSAMDYAGGGYGGWIHEGYEKREVKLGQFGLSNQPAYHMPWMYLHSDEPWQAQYWTRIARPRAYSGEAIGYGYMGEEDNGAMASWYVWATLGLYPLDLGSGQLVLGSPEFAKTVITDENGKKITINAVNNSFKNLYIQSMKVNGADYRKLYLEADLLKRDLVIDLVMGPEPNKTWFTEAPPSLTEGEDLPTALADLTTENTPVTVAAIPATQSTVILAGTGITAANMTTLFNNNAGATTTASDATFSSTTPSITYFDPVAPKVEIYTMTSPWTANSRYPTAWTFSASNNGTEWTILDQRSGEVFNWRKYTRPFAIAAEKQGNYKYYKLDVTAVSSGSGSLMLAQMEFLADTYARVTPLLLAAAIDAAQARLDSAVRFGQGTIDELEAVLMEARAMLEANEATGFKIQAMIDKINTANAGLIAIRFAHDLNVATEFNESSGPGREGTAPNFNINGTAPNSYVVYKYVDFGDKENFNEYVTFNYAADSTSCNNGSSVEVRLGSPTGTLVAVFDRNSELATGADHPTGNWTTGANWSTYRNIRAPLLQNVNGIHDVYLVFRTGTGSPNQWVCNVRNFRFTAPEDVSGIWADMERYIEFAERDDLLGSEHLYTNLSWSIFTDAYNKALVANANDIILPGNLAAAADVLRKAIGYKFGFLEEDEYPLTGLHPTQFVKAVIIEKEFEDLQGNNNYVGIIIRETYDNGKLIKDFEFEGNIENGTATTIAVGPYSVFVHNRGQNTPRLYANIVGNPNYKYEEDPNAEPPVLVSVKPSASVDKLQGNQNVLHIYLDAVFSDGETIRIAKSSFAINNNSAGTFTVVSPRWGTYRVYVSTSENTKITAIRLV